MKTFTFFIALSVLCTCTLIAKWTHIGLEGRSIKDIAVGNNIIFAVTADSGSVYRSTDEGINWEMVFSSGASQISTSPSGSVFIIKGNPGYCCDSLFRSTDNGVSWMETLTGYLPVMEVSPTGTLVGVFDGDFGNGIIHRSTDDGLTWDEVGTSPDSRIAFFKNGDILISGETGCFECHHGWDIITLSIDDGLTWKDIWEQLPSGLGVLNVDSNGKIFFSLSDGLYRTTDLCTTWTKISKVIPSCILALPYGGILAGTNGGGIFLFSDDGDSLGTLNEGLTNLNVHTLAMDSLGYVYAGTDNGVFIVSNFIFSPTMVQELNAGWNLFSLPLHPQNHFKGLNYPGVLSCAYEYTVGYEQCESLKVGIGYWMKVGATTHFPLLGDSVYNDKVNVLVGWNLIGSISVPILTSSIISGPPGIVTSQFYCYNGGYKVTDTIQPGKGYWVKVNQPGSLILSSSTEMNIAARIKIVPTSEQPPPAPTGEISSIKSQIPNKYALEQNYPNPFNPTTVINYQLPLNSYVTLKVYNLLGQEVTTLVNDTQDVGYKSVTWDATNNPSGIYFYRLIAESYIETKKLLLLK
jgi:hypothetical protein